MSNFFYLPLTIGVFVLAKHFQQRFSVTWLNPVLVSIVVLVAGLLTLDIPFNDYNQYSGWLSKLLEPAVVALGVPLYKQLNEIRSELPKIALTIAVSAMVAIVTTVSFALVIGSSGEIAASLAPKSVTTPIAVLISEQVSGEPALTAIAVLITGLVGAVVGIPLLKICGVHSNKAQGIAMGTACHALGTARIAEEGHQHGAYSALALVLSATFSAILCPIVVPLLV